MSSKMKQDFLRAFDDEAKATEYKRCLSKPGPTTDECKPIKAEFKAFVKAAKDSKAASKAASKATPKAKAASKAVPKDKSSPKVKPVKNYFSMIPSRDVKGERLYHLRESLAVVRINNKKVTVFSDKKRKKIEAEFDYIGYFPCGIYEGSINPKSGGCILVATSERTFISITGGYHGPNIDKVYLEKANASSLQCCYTIVSGGDPGSLFAMGSEFMYFLGMAKLPYNKKITWVDGPSVFHIKRDKKQEDEYCKENKSKKNFPIIVDMYLTKEIGKNRTFGYDPIKDFKDI